MRRTMKTLVLLALGAALTGCIHMSLHGVKGSGVKAAEERDVSEFTAIALTGSPTVRVSIGEPRSLTVETDDNLLELITTEVRGGTLRIGSEKSFSSRIGVTILVTTPELEAVSVTGSGDIFVEGLDTVEFEASVTGSGDVVVTGRAEVVEAEVTGSGDVDLSAVQALEASARVLGSGDVLVFATEFVDASITGSGDIEYGGDPAEVRRDVRGSGDIVAR